MSCSDVNYNDYCHWHIHVSNMTLSKTLRDVHYKEMCIHLYIKNRISLKFDENEATGQPTNLSVFNEHERVTPLLRREVLVAGQQRWQCLHSHS
jgi:hypothetical protein